MQACASDLVYFLFFSNSRERWKQIMQKGSGCSLSVYLPDPHQDNSLTKFVMVGEALQTNIRICK